MRVLAAAALALILAQPTARPPAQPSSVLPDTAAVQLAESLEAASGHRRHVWRDTPPFHKDGTVTAYIEIPRGDRQKWEFSIPRNRRVIDRVLPRAVGGYPVNYGFVPQTISYDGDPFDALVLGRPLRGGATIRGEVVGILHMEDETGRDSKVILSPVMMGKRLHELTDGERARIAEFFGKYKAHEPGKFSRVLGWGSPEEGLAYVHQMHRFFTNGS
jgi:inorganic pyrophosphatase